MNIKDNQILAVNGIDASHVAEQRMLDRGKERFDKDDAQTPAQFTSSGQKIISDALDDVAAAIQTTIQNELANENPGRRPDWLEDIVKVEPQILAFLGLQAGVQAANLQASEATFLVRLGKRISIECLGADIAEVYYTESPKTKSRTAKSIPFIEDKLMRHKVTAARKFAQKKLLLKDAEEWSSERCVKVATPVRNAIMQCGIFERNRTTSRVRGAPKTRTVWSLTEEAMENIMATKERLSWMRPVFEPMLRPPVPWTSTTTGCYENPKLACLVPLVKSATFKQNQEIDLQCKGGTPQYLRALNLLQATPLAINSFVTDAVEWAWENQDQIASDKFPTRRLLTVPKLEKEWEALSADERMYFSQTRASIIEKNAQIFVNATRMKCDLDTARELEKAGKFWLPWNFDFRHRVYPVSHFNYHRDDHIKAQFKLYNSKKLDETNLEWLLLHIANCGDFNKISKASLDDRQFWAAMNLDLIYQSGKDFIANAAHWTAADKPFQYLAGCREYYLYRKAQDRGEEYLCGLPINLDGSNSGCQHYAALSKNAEDGALVNLVPSEKPADLYQEVADKVIKALDESESSVFRDQWKAFGVDRSIVKRPVMTYCYSAAVYGFHNQIFEDLMTPIETVRLGGGLVEWMQQKRGIVGAPDVHPFGDSESERRASAMFLAKLVFAAVEETITSANEAMQYLQSVANALAAEGKSVVWTAPTGFPVHQKYVKTKTRKLKPFLYDRAVHLKNPESKGIKRSQISLAEPDFKTIDKKRMANAISPNVIHSLDAAHLLLTILHCQESGVNDFFVIHDSFGCCASDTDEMFVAVRETFIAIYKDWDFFSEFDKQARSRLADPENPNLSPVPVQSDLDLNLVADSDYCFS